MVGQWTGAQAKQSDFCIQKKKHEGRSILTFVINAYSIKY